MLDWRWAESGVIAAIRSRQTLTVHARSVFLKGILASGDPRLWPRVEGTDPASLISWLSECAWKFGRQNVADLCLAYAQGQDWIDGVVIGMETEEQLGANLLLSTRPALALADCAAIEACRPRVPEPLLDPARWPPR